MNEQCRRLLVVMPSWMGDIVMSTPALRAVRETLPEAHITASIRPGLEPILEGLPCLDAIETASLRGLLGPMTDGRRFAKSRPDTVLLLPNSFRSALFARFTGARRRVGSARDGRSTLLTDAVPMPEVTTPETTLQEYVHLVEQGFGCDVSDLTPTLETTTEEEALADRILEGLEAPFIVINPGANREDKRWPVERFTEVADALRERRACTILVNGAPAEADLVDRLVSGARPGIVNLARAGSSLSALKAIVRRSSLMISNDTGPRHLAAAFGTPCVALFGPTDRRWTVLPEACERHLVAEPFLPEDHVADKHPRACMIDRIASGDVIHAADELLEENED